jgi:hypothetical protein
MVTKMEESAPIYTRYAMTQGFWVTFFLPQYCPPPSPTLTHKPSNKNKNGRPRFIRFICCRWTPTVEHCSLFAAVGLYCGTRINVEDHALFAVVDLYYGKRINVEDHALFDVIGLYCDTT